MSKPVCLISGPLFTRSGYGGWSETIAKSLLRYGKYEVMVNPTVWGSCSKKNLDEDIKSPEVQELLQRVLRGPLTKQPEIFCQMTIPNEFQPVGKFNIGFTAGIESSAASPQFLEGMNRMNLNIVTSKFTKDVFLQTKYNKKLPSGVSEELSIKSPMEVLFWGADTNTYKKTDVKVESVDAVLNKIPEQFAFLFVGQWTSGNINADRKAIGHLIQTFLQAFANVSNPPCLILKTSGAQICVTDRNDCINKIHDITMSLKQSMPDAKFPNVYLLHGELKEVEMNALFNHEKVKLHISFSHGEGFGHPLLLATLSGKPLLASNWSGHLDFLNPKYSRFLEGSLVPVPREAINDWFIEGSQWFDVDYTGAKQKMRYCFDNYDSMLFNSEKLRLENAEKFSIKAMDTAFHAILDKYIPQFEVEHKIVLPKLRKINIPSLADVATPLNMKDGNITITPVTVTGSN